MVSSGSLISFLATVCVLLPHSRLVASFSPRSWKTTRSTTTALRVSFSPADEAAEFHNPNRIAEFRDLEPLTESVARRQRKDEDKKIRRRFAKHGDDLWALRKVIGELSKKLLKAINNDSRDNEQAIREQLRLMEEQDPELVYKAEFQKMRLAQSEGRDEDAADHSRNAIAARSQLPQYNLNGLWVGK